jgi:hypothetical protein
MLCVTGYDRPVDITDNIPHRRSPAPLIAGHHANVSCEGQGVWSIGNSEDWGPMSFTTDQGHSGTVGPSGVTTVSYSGDSLTVSSSWPNGFTSTDTGEGDCTVPEETVPETSTPDETLPPETTAPETTAPETTTPASTTPEATTTVPAPTTTALVCPEGSHQVGNGCLLDEDPPSETIAPDETTTTVETVDGGPAPTTTVRRGLPTTL